MRCEADPENSDKRLMEALLPYLKRGAFDFTFLYLGAIDEVGHDHGWMSERYLEQVEHSDALLRDILGVLPADTTLIIHRDHGDHGRSHGTDAPEDMTIPWLIMAPKIKEGHVLEAPLACSTPLRPSLISSALPAPELGKGASSRRPSWTTSRRDGVEVLRAKGIGKS